MNDYKTALILIAEDDEEDRMLTQEAFEESGLNRKLHFVHDGEELLDYLNHRSSYDDEVKYPVPSLILLDLNMPRKDGREALKEIKAHPVFKRIPVIVLTTSKAEEDILKTYDMGVSSYITKPVTYQGLVEIANALGKYWFQIVQLP